VPYDYTPDLFERRQQLILFSIAGLFMGLIPLMQPHSFAAVGIIVLVSAGLGTAWKLVRMAIYAGEPKAYAAQRSALYESLLEYSTYGAVSFALGLPQFLKHFVHRISFGVGTRGHGFVRLSPAWMEEGKGESPAYMWWKALGLFGPMYLLSFTLLRTAHQRFFFAGFAFLFVVCNVVMFQPWHLDNTKLLYVWVFGASGTVGLALARGQEAARSLRSTPLRLAGLAIVGAAYWAMTFSGSLATWREMLNYAKTYDDMDLDFAEWIKSSTPPDAVFMHDMARGHIRVESSLAGRQIAHGFDGWLSSHGINSAQRREDLFRVVQGSRAGVAALATHNISYITIDASTKSAWSYSFLDDVADFVATNGKYSVYAVLPAVRAGLQERACVAAPAASSSRDCAVAGCWWLVDGRMPRCVEKARKREVVDCLQTTVESCTSVGCLWDEAFPGPWCTKPTWQQGDNGPARIQQLRPGVPGSDCGWHNMAPGECADRGCEWGQPIVDPAYGPWCRFVEQATTQGRRLGSSK
jgi:hypothetical protein